MSLIRLERRSNNELYVVATTKKVKPLEIFPPRIISLGIYSPRDNKKTIDDLEESLINLGYGRANAYEISNSQISLDKSICAVGIYRIKKSIFEKVTNQKKGFFQKISSIKKDIKEYLTEEF